MMHTILLFVQALPYNQDNNPWVQRRFTIVNSCSHLFALTVKYHLHLVWIELKVEVEIRHV